VPPLAGSRRRGGVAGRWCGQWGGRWSGAVGTTRPWSGRRAERRPALRGWSGGRSGGWSGRSRRVPRRALRGARNSQPDTTRGKSMKVTRIVGAGPFAPEATFLGVPDVRRAGGWGMRPRRVGRPPAEYLWRPLGLSSGGGGRGRGFSSPRRPEGGDAVGGEHPGLSEDDGFCRQPQRPGQVRHEPFGFDAGPRSLLFCSRSRTCGAGRGDLLHPFLPF
jgi:hypothetical protein